MSELIEVEIFWDGDGWYFAHKNDSERLGGPHPRIHPCWKQADDEGYEVVEVSRTRALRTYRKTAPVNANSPEPTLQTLPKT